MIEITRFRFFISLSVMYAAMIFYLSSRTDLSIIAVDSLTGAWLYELADFFKNNNMLFMIDLANYCYDNFDKLLHMGLYFGFGIILYLTFHSSESIFLRKYAPLFAIAIGILYGVTDEYHQSFVPGRVSSTADLLANGIGVVLAQFVFWALVIFHILSRKFNNL